MIEWGWSPLRAEDPLMRWREGWQTLTAKLFAGLAMVQFVAAILGRLVPHRQLRYSFKHGRPFEPAFVNAAESCPREAG
jgi:hypothetical protein